MRWGRVAAASVLVALAAGCAADAGVAPVAVPAGGPPGRAALPPSVPERPPAAAAAGDSADPLVVATARYLASPAGHADAWLLTYAGAHPPEDYWSRPGGCTAWFAGTAPPEGGGGLLAGDPPAAPAFGGYATALRLARLDLVFRRVRCGTDPDPGALPAHLAGAAAGWRALTAYAETHRLTVPDPDPPPPAVPPAPVAVEGTGSLTRLVAPPVTSPGEPFLLTVEHAPAGASVTALGPGGVQARLPALGTHILDDRAGQRTTALRVEATGSWHLRLSSFALMRRATLPGEIEGEGPDVVLVDLSLLGQARAVTLDGAARVTVHRSGRPAEALGASLPDDDVVVLEVDAPGRWRLTT